MHVSGEAVALPQKLQRLVELAPLVQGVVDSATNGMTNDVAHENEKKQLNVAHPFTSNRLRWREWGP